MNDETDSGSVYTDEEEPEPQSRTTSRSSRSSSSRRPVRNEGVNAHDEQTNGKFLQSPVRGDRKARTENVVSERRRLKGHYSNAYRELYNDTVAELTATHGDGTAVPLPASQIGVINWSTLEKEILFTKLASLGRDDIQGIAAAIESKSQAEVHDYLLLLQEGLLEESLFADRPVFGTAEIPAASELSEECEAALDLAAGALARQVDRLDRKREANRHGEAWLLTEKTAEHVEALLSTDHDRSVEKEDNDADGGSEPEHTSEADADVGVDIPVPSANLLHLRNWLQLSKLFMNHAPDLHSGWRSLVESEDETPTIFRTAFDDFHNLAVSLTRRLVQASIFQATSRLRATDQNNPSHMIRRQDVDAAVDVLGLKNDWNDFWTGCARRNKLQVYSESNNADNSRPRLGKGFELSYDEIEAALREAEENIPQQIIESVEDPTDEEELYDNSDFWTEVSSSETNEVGNNDNDHHPRRHRPTRDLKTEADAEDAYLEALDAQASKTDEAGLWALLGKDPPQRPKEEDLNIPAAPLLKRKRATELKDWREGLEYQPEWTRFPSPIAPRVFGEMGMKSRLGKKRRMEAYDEISRRHGEASELEQEDGSLESGSDGPDSTDGSGGDPAAGETDDDDEDQVEESQAGSDDRNQVGDDVVDDQSLNDDDEMEVDEDG